MSQNNNPRPQLSLIASALLGANGLPINKPAVELSHIDRLATMLDNPSVPQSLKDDLKQALTERKGAMILLSKDTMNPAHREHLTGHRNLACMIVGHIGNWREALKHQLIDSEEPDRSYIEHELEALTAIERCVAVALSQ